MNDAESPRPLGAARGEEVAAWRPLVLDPSREEDLDTFWQLSADARTLCHDTLAEQLRDLVAAREPALRLGPAELDARARELVTGRPLLEVGRWIYYPWSRRLVHLLAEPEFRELRTDRNRYKITREEQDRLRRCRIGIAGLSVGQATAATLALEGVGGAFHLADFDTLALSNLNRLRAGVHELGLNKAVLAARQLFEIDPYLEVRLFPHGVEESNLDCFLGAPPGAQRLDLLVEECDDLVMKLRLRERARELGLPVLMETSDRGMLDIERFDRESHRPLLHGLVDGVRAEELRGASPREKLPIVLRILDERRISPAMAATLPEIGRTVSTWPQLASAVALGGAVATDAARRLLLGRLTTSGRFYVDLEELVREGTEER